MRELERIVLLHVHKTAGSSLAAALRSAYGEQASFPLFMLRDLVDFDPAGLSRFSCFTGHFGPGLLDLLTGPRLTATLLRDPVERSLSHYFYWRDRTRPEEVLAFVGGDQERARRLRTGSMAGVLDDPAVRSALRDFQCRFLGKRVEIRALRGQALPFHAEMSWPSLAEEEWPSVVEAAHETLESCDFVGVAERFDESAAGLFQRLSLEVPAAWPRERESEARLNLADRSWRSHPQVDAETFERLEELTRQDRELHRHACDRLEACLAPAASSRLTDRPGAQPEPGLGPNFELEPILEDVSPPPQPAARSAVPGQVGRRLLFLVARGGFREIDGAWLEVALQLSTQGHDVSVWKPGQRIPIPAASRLREAGIELTDVDEFQLPFSARVLNRLVPGNWQRGGHEIRLELMGRAMGTAQPDLVVIWQDSALTGTWLAEVARRCQLPYVLATSAVWPEHWPEDAYRPWVSLAYRQSRRNLFSTRGALETVEQFCGERFPQSDTDAVPPVDESLRPLPWPECGPLRLACVRPSAGEGSATLLSAAARVRESGPHPEFSLTFFGDGEGSSGLPEMARLLGLDQVFFEALKPASELWLEHHLLAAPKAVEGLGTDVLEAMRCGRPVLATPMSGGSLVLEGHTGFVAEAAETHAVAEALDRALRQSGTWKSLGATASDRAWRSAAGGAGDFAGRLIRLAG